MKWRTLKELDSTEGTVQLVNVHDARNLKVLGGKRGDRDIVLIPQPSSDPNDPLNWPTWKKNLAFFWICWFTFLGNTCIGGMGPGLQILLERYDVPAAEATTLLTYAVLLQGVSNFIWVPAGIYFGRRPVFLLAGLVFFVCQIWGAVVDDFDLLRASIMVSAVAGGSTEALGAALASDLFFLHERGLQIGIYVTTLAWGSSLGPMCAGFMWGSGQIHLFKQVTSGLCGLMFLGIFFFFPETRFKRDQSKALVASQGTSEVLDAKTVEAVLHQEDIERTASNATTSAMTPRRSYLKSLSPWSGIESQASFLSLFVRPFALIAYPAVLWSSVSYSIVIAWVVVIATTNSMVMQVPPYNMSATINSLIYIGSLIGNIIGAISSGPVADWWVSRQARRNDGVFNPESRLVWLWVAFAFTPVGCLIYGFGVQYQLHWMVIFLGNALVSIGLTNVSTIGMSYVIDSYYPVAPEALILINGLKNIVCFPITNAAVPWVESMGHARAFGTMAGITVGVLALAMPLAIYGKQIRHYTSTHWKLICW